MNPIILAIALAVPPPPPPPPAPVVAPEMEDRSAPAYVTPTPKRTLSHWDRRKRGLNIARGTLWGAFGATVVVTLIGYVGFELSTDVDGQPLGDGSETDFYAKVFLTGFFTHLPFFIAASVVQGHYRRHMKMPRSRRSTWRPRRLSWNPSQPMAFNF